MNDPTVEVERPHLAPAARAEAVWYGSAMLRTFGWFYWILGLGRLLGRVRLEEHSVDRIRTAADKGPVVYVLLRRSTANHLALNTVLNRRRLPLSVWANGVINFWWQPVLEAWREVFHRLRYIFSDGLPDPIRSGWLSRTVAAGAPVTVFLTNNETWRSTLSRTAPGDPLAALLQAQQDTDLPIQLIPTLVVWDRSPDISDQDAVVHFLSGTHEAPTRLMMARNVVFRSQEAFIQVGEPVDLAEFCSRVDESKRAKALRVLLRRYLRREARLVRGPRLLPHHVMKNLVLENPPMRDLAQREAEATGQSVDQIKQLMSNDFDTIAARFKWWVVRLLDIALRPLWTRVYSGVNVRDEDLDHIRTAMRGGTAILLPCHKSHFDYVLLSWVFYEHDLIVPHVVAGVNMAFWPVSIFLRGAGGFFIKRSFANERIFPAVFSRYLRELINHGYPVEFFIEGGRSRTGKLLPPRLGVLGMVLDAAAVRPRSREVTLLPIQLCYEQVAEEGTYARELAGEEKQAESVGQVVQARSILSRRFGRVYLRVGEPILCSTLVDPTPDTPRWTQLSRMEKREVLQPLGERIIHRIAQAAVVLPTSVTALALLAHHRRGIRHADLVARMDRFRSFLQRAGAEEASSMQYFSQARGEALERFRKAGLILATEHKDERLWGINVDTRITLEGYKNQLLQFFVPAGFVSMAARPLPDGSFGVDDVRGDVARIAWVLRREFILDPDCGTTELTRQGLADLVAHGALTEDDGRYELADMAAMGEIFNLFRHFLETYTLVLRSIDKVGGVDTKEVCRVLQADGPALLSSGQVTRPEALSTVTLENAVKSYIDDGTFTHIDDLVHGSEHVLGQLKALAPMVD